MARKNGMEDFSSMPWGWRGSVEATRADCKSFPRKLYLCGEAVADADPSAAVSARLKAGGEIDGPSDFL